MFYLCLTELTFEEVGLLWSKKEFERPVPAGVILAVCSKTGGWPISLCYTAGVLTCFCNVIMTLVLTLQSFCPARGWRGASWRWRWPGRPWCGSCLWGFGRCCPHTQAVDPWVPTLHWALPAGERGSIKKKKKKSQHINFSRKSQYLIFNLTQLLKRKLCWFKAQTGLKC